MKRAVRGRIFIIVLVFLSFLSSTAASQDVLRATLRNGMRVVIVKNTLAPVVTIETNYLAGGNECPQGSPAWPMRRSSKEKVIVKLILNNDIIPPVESIIT